MTAERHEPDSIIALTAMTGVVGDIQDDPDTKTWGATNPLRANGNNDNVDVHCSFPTPTDNLTVGANLQEFRVLLRPFDAGQTGDPAYRIELWESGTLIRAGTQTVIQNDGGEVVASFTWNANELSVGSGAGVEIKVFGIKSGGSPGARNTIDIGAIEWNADYTESSGGRIMGGIAGPGGLAGKGGGIAA